MKFSFGFLHSMFICMHEEVLDFSEILLSYSLLSSMIEGINAIQLVIIEPKTLFPGGRGTTNWGIAYSAASDPDHQSLYDKFCIFFHISLQATA